MIICISFSDNLYVFLTHGNLEDYIQSGNIPMVRVSVGLAVWDGNVSQGSVFSPICFSLFINEMKKYIL